MGIKLSNDRRDYNLNVNYILRAGGTLTEGIIIRGLKGCIIIHESRQKKQ